MKYRVSDRNIIKDHQASIRAIIYLEGKDKLISIDDSGEIIITKIESPYSFNEYKKFNINSKSGIISMFPLFYKNTGYVTGFGVSFGISKIEFY